MAQIDGLQKLMAKAARDPGSYNYQRKQESQNRYQKNNDDTSDKGRAIEIHIAHGNFINRYKDQPGALKDAGFLEPDWHDKNNYLYEVDWDKCNFIHRAIKELRGDLPDPLLDVVGRMVVEKPDSLTNLDVQKKSPLLCAAKFNLDILFFFINILIPETIFCKIDTPCLYNEKKCPLKEIFETRKRQCLMDQNASMEAKCLHGKMDCKKLIKENQKLYIALQNAFASVAEQAYPCLTSILRAYNFDEGNLEVSNGQVAENSWIRLFKTFLKLCPDSVFNYASAGKLTPLQMAVDLYKAEALNYDLLFEIVQALIKRAPWSVFNETVLGDKTTTAYKIVRELKYSHDSPIKTQIAQVEELLKNACIGYQGQIWDATTNKLTSKITSKEKMSYLYSNVEHEKQLYFNLAGEYGIIDRDYIEIIKQHSSLRFETALEFVRLPCWKPQRLADELNIEVDPYVVIFRYIWDQGTTKIFLLDVDDDGPEPHTNASIREALQGEGLESSSPPRFEIETWKWKKFDICTETVATAAPTARHVWLWSSGNTAVLRGWACGPDLGTMKQLESLTVVINPKNAKDALDCNKYLETFKSEVSRKCDRLLKENITIRVYPLYSSVTDAGDQNMSIKRASDWIQELSVFKEFIGNLVRKSNVQVKVAVLDDGCRLFDFNGRREIGKSFCPDDRAYFAGRCEHGTSMARCIREVCPDASLYIGRLDVTYTLENQAFTIESCCKALKWAIAMGVDVVCMSWAFPIKGPGKDSHEDEFHRLVTEAQEKEITLLGSLPDRGPKVQRFDLAPIGFNEVIRIGSATVHGEGVPENRFGEAEFLLPSEEGPEGEEIVEGSSYATAYASGLAAAILLTIRLLKFYSDADNHEEIQRAEQIARTRHGMKRIFKRLTQNQTDNFARPYLTFGQKAGDFGNSESGKIRTLKKIVHDLLLRDVERVSG